MISSKGCSKIRLGVIGCGQLSRSVHLPLLSRIRNAEVAAIADIDENNLEIAGSLHPSARKFRNYSELISIKEIEGVVISVPPLLHSKIAIDAINQGKHIYLEKPLAENISSAHAVLRAWREADVVGMIGFNFRFNHLYEQMRNIIRKGLMDEIIGARSTFTTIAHSRPDWTAVQGEGGGVLPELASHEIDLTRFIFDAEIERVFAESSGSLGNENVSMQLLLSNGISVQGLYSLGSVEDCRYEVYGSSLKLSMDRYSSWRVNKQCPTAKGLSSRIIDLLRETGDISYGVSKIFSPENERSYRSALECFLEAIRHDHRVKPDIEDGFRVMKTICAAEKSIKSGHAERVDLHASGEPLDEY